MVGPHAALPNAAETHGAGGQMDDYVIDTAAAEAEAAHGLPDPGAVLGEEIEGQRLGPASQVFVDLLKAVEGEDGQDRAEDLLLHHGVAVGDAV